MKREVDNLKRTFRQIERTVKGGKQRLEHALKRRMRRLERLRGMTYRNQVTMPINGRTRSIDHCIHRIVAALNAVNIPTVACCCGHGAVKGNIVLEDGRVLLILPTTPESTDEWKEAIAL